MTAAACLLAADLAHEDRLVAIMDIGTNTELIVGNRHRILAASCPAGPAFEGGAIACGMPAQDGAVESVAAGDDGTFRLGVIGDIAPEGLCGSGLVGLLSELIRTGRMNQLGRFEHDARRITIEATGVRGPRRHGRALPAGDASALLRSFRRRVSVQAARVPGPEGWVIEFADTRPDEYFFFDVYGSCVVERLITATGTVPCEACAFEPRDYRRAPHSRRCQRQP